MDQEEINTNIAYRNKEIKLQKARRYALGCPGAEPVTFEEGPAGGGGTAGAGTGGRPGAGGIPNTLEEAALTLKQYAGTIAGAEYSPGDPHTCTLPSNGPVLSVGSSSSTNNPERLLNDRYTSEVKVNGLTAKAGSVGEDMQGYWGAVIYWSLNGVNYAVVVTVPYPEVKDDTPDKRQELYNQCLRRATDAAISFDKAVRKLR